MSVCADRRPVENLIKNLSGTLIASYPPNAINNTPVTTPTQPIGKWYNNSDKLCLKPDDIIFNNNYPPWTPPPPLQGDDQSVDAATTATDNAAAFLLGGFPTAPNTTPISACSLPCGPGHIRKQQGDTCCWICDPCADSEYVADPSTCADCPAGAWPNDDRLSCYDLPVEVITWTSSWYAAIPLTVATLGIVATIAVIVLFIRANDTPLVRASGRELSYMLLGGILMCYLNTFALLAPPSVGTCGLQRTGIGLAFSIVYGALLVKTNRISRIFKTSKMSAKRLKYISPRSQVTFASAMAGEWMVPVPVEPRRAEDGDDGLLNNQIIVFEMI